jgi:glucosamine-6-phosphate deaminase
VHVIYQTSGNLAVPDDAVRRAAELVLELAEAEEVTPAPKDGTVAFARKVREQLEAKDPFDLDPPEIRKFKGLLRRGEARSALRTCRVALENVHFCDLPFYENGRYRRFEITEEDVQSTAAALDRLKPHSIFATGTGSDPSSVEAICFEVLRRALEKLRNADWRRHCRVWLYAGGDREWDVHAIDMAVPLSPDELRIKEQAIYQHQTQRGQMPSEGDRRREAWRQEVAMNQKTAETYDRLGLAEYEAIEAFRRWG